MPEHIAPRKKNHGDEPVRIVYHAGERTFARLFNESSLEEVKNVVRRKLGLDKSTAVVLKQIKSGKLLDLEDDDDFQAFEALLLSSPSTDIEIEVTVAAQSSEPQPERVPSATEPVGASTSKPTEPQPSKPVEASTSTAMTPKRKRAVSSGDVAASGAPKSAEEPSQKKKKDQAKKSVGPSEPPAASTSTVKPPRTEVQTSTAEPVKEKRKREKKVKEPQPASVVDLHAKKASDDQLSPGFPTSSTVAMAHHALAILEQNDQWNWSDMNRIPELRQQGRQLVAITHKLLYHLIVESQKFGGDVLEHFWKQLGTCDEKLKENIKSLAKQDFVSAEKSSDVLFRGLDRKKVDFEPMLKMAAEFFTHLGVAFVNPGGRKSGTGTAFSVSEIVNEETDKLLEQVNEEGDFGKRKQETLKALSFRRDGESCLLTRMRFRPSMKNVTLSELAHIVPNSVQDKPDILKCIAMFAGAAATSDITVHLNTPGNVMNMQHDARTTYDNLEWGIEAKEEGRGVKYFFRMVPDPDVPCPGFIALKDGDEIQFGKGLKPEGIRKPIPKFCNLQLAVARVMKLSGAADIILEWMDRADDDGYDHLFIASEEFCDMLHAKLFLSGRAVVA